MEATLIVSLLAISISAVTAWFSLFHRGKVKMTQPNIFAIIPKEGLSAKCPKIFLRVLLYCTSKTGQAIESMFIKIARGDDEVQKFQYWAYGERDKLVPGSGMFVGPQGYEANHHFSPLENNAAYDFRQGQYSIEVYGKTVGMRGPVCMTTLTFELSAEAASALKESDDMAVFFWWDSESEIYISKIDRRPRYI